MKKDEYIIYLINYMHDEREIGCTEETLDVSGQKSNLGGIKIYYQIVKILRAKVSSLFHKFAGF